MRKSFDGLMAVIRDNFQMDPFSNAVFLFFGRKKYDESSLLRPGWVRAPAEASGQWKVPVAP